MKTDLKQQGKDFTYTDFIIFFSARTIKNFPLLNAAFINGEIHYYNSIDIGIAVDTDMGLVVPVIKNAQRKTLEEISTERAKLAEAARNGKLSKTDIENCRFVISNLGMFGVVQFQAIINPPGTSIMAVGSIEKEPVVENDDIKIAKTMWVSLSFDHRVIDGAYGGRFLKRFKTVMENPAILLI